MSPAFPAYVVEGTPHQAQGGVRHLTLDQLPAGDVVIEVEWSGVNYKDALAASGHPGVAPHLPHVPGIDCAGRVVQSQVESLPLGKEVLVTGYDQGATRWGGYSAMVRTPAEWVVELPEGMTTRQAMIYGTAGFTAAQCVKAITDRVSPEAGPVLVTGATGGVGVFAVGLLAKLGYRVTAVSGKPEAATLLGQLGVVEVLPREALADKSGNPLLAARWAAAVDTVGGAPLASLLRSIKHRGVVAACGLVAGDRLEISLYPFLLRGVTLCGIDSAKCPRAPRLEIWDLLAEAWRIDLPEGLVHETDFDGLPAALQQILAGKMRGRTLVRPTTPTKA
ncbi:YhdH/YhfP family quinone oxidoreductase [Botrimarina hoheduenensis]|uniref:Putative acrylyl-CoA reductase AcuI n=1 Tax=Botrimarina hoheduenensis TaxID=2528000 RepID=A0A5C5W8D4_9BACT|nr:YhdH/YhfP family quinone oxidoreductase [Botrimarina hoheduenensis]TWT46717.1 putative acrylyl-CoA reductase AcuI [Botrimarina hoheduenensis]